jgi:hypothetical protein
MQKILFVSHKLQLKLYPANWREYKIITRCVLFPTEMNRNKWKPKRIPVYAHLHTDPERQVIC